MSLKINGTEISNIIYNGVTLDKVVYNGTVVFERLQKITVGDSAILLVKKITSNVYVSSTDYPDCVFFGISVRADDNVDALVSFGGVTKTVSAGTEAYVTFGTYGNQTDATVDILQGELTIQNSKYIGVMSFNTTKTASKTMNNIILDILQWDRNWNDIKGIGSIIGWTIISEVPSEFPPISNFISPDVITSISQGFQNWQNLTTLRINKFTTSINSGFIAGCTSLIDFEIDAQNPNYYIQDGCVIERSTNTLIGTFGNFTVPNNVTKIGSSSFAVSQKTQVTLPAGVTELGSGFLAFSNISTLRLLSTTPPTALSMCFNNNNLTRIEVPASALAEYQSIAVSPNVWATVKDLLVGV